ncbi:MULTISPECIES: hypothetical protein [unclassified Paenibacillus]|uniref:hypothetical protein n=1 Tax=unclassified Paenibacillus TaxID=185978 RepID=UPI001AE56F39|nr:MULTISPECIES: hypothetical protein [unclassified Paenibacillus]MBP1154200.1 hypothetical protein [Paenibacillus sp. PvP091]MBP1170415.1 hypothetical protein [Paenibacillus sp. PvR098]MBP2441443.1 hypothetical protein [Paenibacillus sp. PvP052]
MIPFAHTWPYDRIGQDVYVQSCPFCQAANVLLTLKAKDLAELREGVKRLLVFPCCRNKLTLVDADPDYLLADRPLRRNG